MNDVEFKKHLKDLAHGHHHPEEHDWSASPVSAVKKRSGTKTSAAKRRTPRKTAKRK
jgi:hypothetical protein